MSHRATNWAIQQRGLKPATKLVLWFLADCHNPSLGCFPSQEYLADNSEMSRSTVNLHLQKLEEMKLIERVQNWDDKNRKQLPTSYILALDCTKAVSENRTRETGKAVSEKQANPCPKNEQSRVRKSDSNLVSKPVKEPLSSPQAASNEEREADSGFDKKKSELMVGELLKKHPNAKGLPKWTWIKEWKKLNWEEQQLAFERFDNWVAVLRDRGMRVIPTAGIYFKEKLFLDIEAAQAASVAGVRLAVFGSAWMAHRLWQLAHGKRGVWKPSNGTQERMYADKPKLFEGNIHEAKWRCLTNFPTRLADESQLVGDYTRFVQVAVGSAEWDAWNAWHVANKFPPLEPRRGYEWLWVPCINPTNMGINDFITSTSHVEQSEAQDLKKQKSKNEVVA